MIRKPITKTYELILVAISIAVIIGFYSVLSYRQHQVNPSDTTIPNLYQFIAGWKNLSHADSSGDIWILKDTYATGARLFTGLSVGILWSFIIGLYMGVDPQVEAFFRLPITFLGKIPPTAMLAVYFVLFGTDYSMYVAMIALGIFPSLAMAVFGASRTDVSDHAIYKAYTLGASNYEVVYEVVVKQILPRIIENIRLVIGPALVFLIAAEWMMADVGFGYRLRIQSRLLNMNVVYSYLFMLAIGGWFLDWLLLQLRNRLCPWFKM